MKLTALLLTLIAPLMSQQSTPQAAPSASGAPCQPVKSSFVARRNHPPAEWQYIYQSAGNSPVKAMFVIENTGSQSYINIVTRIEPSLRGREVHVDPPVPPGSSVTLASVYSIRVAANENDPTDATGTLTVVPVDH
jgi:hypothetical protein